ncbi:DUF2806 domain-containing protein [Rhizobium acidisoli]|uniref:DUF2806 domain-containing protein n=1 Tax=Rhizobium acidisoli TaxID=1538158 RepID=A0AAE5U0L7_9HYPH|nr:DUF2806 domain-containing protein [Rhizobium acidisoli]KPH09117.1 hypothetical protein AOG23_07515 [Rhizobium acidisoli]QAS80171.1 DUF2806 domain-containing protein [Rhizobium acidisoli]
MPENEDEDIGLAVDWSTHGFKAKIKSRFMSALDRLGATRLIASSNPLDRKNAIGSALTGSYVSLIKVASQTIENQVEQDPRLAAKLLMSLSRAEKEAENIDASLEFALQDLRNNPELSDQSDKAADTMNAEMVNRWGRYAGEATSEAVREKWGKVLASEIRAPGTFSHQTLRIIDEVDPDIGRIFEKLCQNRFTSWVPVVTAGVSAHEVEEMQHAGLLLHQEFYASVAFSNTTRSSDESDWWIIGNEERSVAVSKAAPAPSAKLFASIDDMRVENGNLRINVFSLTRAGRAIATIIPQDRASAVKRLASALVPIFGSDNVVVLKRNDDNSLSEDNEWAPP